jgi:hypothetical protein
MPSPDSYSTDPGVLRLTSQKLGGPNSLPKLGRNWVAPTPSLKLGGPNSGTNSGKSVISMVEAPLASERQIL